MAKNKNEEQLSEAIVKLKEKNAQLENVIAELAKDRDDAILLAKSYQQEEPPELIKKLNAAESKVKELSEKIEKTENKKAAKSAINQGGFINGYR